MCVPFVSLFKGSNRDVGLRYSFGPKLNLSRKWTVEPPDCERVYGRFRSVCWFIARWILPPPLPVVSRGVKKVGGVSLNYIPLSTVQIVCISNANTVTMIHAQLEPLHRRSHKTAVHPFVCFSLVCSLPFFFFIFFPVGTFRCFKIAFVLIL